MLTLRKVTSHPHVTDAYQVIYDGFAVGSIARHQISNQVIIWRWGIYEFGRAVPGRNGQQDSREAAMTAFRAAWDSIMTPADIEKMLEAKRTVD